MSIQLREQVWYGSNTSLLFLKEKFKHNTRRYVRILQDTLPFCIVCIAQIPVDDSPKCVWTSIAAINLDDIE